MLKKRKEKKKQQETRSLIKHTFATLWTNHDSRSGVALLLVSIGLYGVLGWPIVGSSDILNHLHLVSRFAESFLQGQVIPRTVVAPLMFPDATLPTSDVPTFQYYGFLEGALALPFLLAGFSAVRAVIVTVVLLRWGGALILHRACRNMGATAATSFVASFAYLISPYLMSCFYGRGALSEVLVQSIVPLVPYSYALAAKQAFKQSILAVGAAIFLLALAHNVHVVYGVLLILVLSILSFDARICLASTLGVILGLCLSAWQWLPIQLTVHDFARIRHMTGWKIGVTDLVNRSNVSYSGMFGLPERFFPQWIKEPTNLYLTVGLWTIPFASVLFISAKPRRYAVPVLGALILFFILTYTPFDIYWLLPTPFAAVEDTYRLLTYVSLLSAFSLAFLPFNMNKWFAAACIAVMLASQAPVLYFYAGRLSQVDVFDQYRFQGAPINFYYVDSPDSGVIRRNDGVLLSKNSFYLHESRTGSSILRLRGVRTDSLRPLTIFVAPVDQPEFPISQELVIEPRSFDVTLKLSHGSAWYRVYTRPLTVDSSVDMVVFGFNIYAEDPTSYVPAEMLRTVSAWGYRRRFVLADTNTRLSPDNEGRYTVEMPLAYSKLFQAWQRDAQLETSCDFNHRMQVKVKSLTDDIEVYYKIPWSAVVLTLLGLVTLVGVFVIQRPR